MELINELERLADRLGVSMNDMALALKKEDFNKQANKDMETIKENEELVGKCFVRELRPRSGMFPKMNRYYKVLSARSTNPYRVECLVFDEFPYYWFEYQSHKISRPGDYYLGSFDFESFHTEDVMARDLKQMTSIEENEFNDCAYFYLEDLLEMKWVCDHYRYGEKLPNHSDWAQPEKKMEW